MDQPRSNPNVINANPRYRLHTHRHQSLINFWLTRKFLVISSTFGQQKCKANNFGMYAVYMYVSFTSYATERTGRHAIFVVAVASAVWTGTRSAWMEAFASATFANHDSLVRLIWARDRPHNSANRRWLHHIWSVEGFPANRKCSELVRYNLSSHQTQQAIWIS